MTLGDISNSFFAFHRLDHEMVRRRLIRVKNRCFASRIQQHFGDIRHPEKISHASDVKQGIPLKECFCSCVANTSFEGWILKKNVWSDVGSQNCNAHVL